jgi:hypothetical protein
MTSITSMTSGQARGCVEESSVMEAMTSGPQARMEAMEAMGGDYPVARAAYCAASVPAVQDRAEWTASDRHLRVHLVLPVSAAGALLFQADGVHFALHQPLPLRTLGPSGPLHVPKFIHGGEAGGKASDIAGWRRRRLTGGQGGEDLQRLRGRPRSCQAVGVGGSPGLFRGGVPVHCATDRRAPFASSPRLPCSLLPV